MTLILPCLILNPLCCTRTTVTLADACHLVHAILDPKLSYSGEPSEAAFNLAHKTDLPLFEWLSQPEQAYASKRFSIGMHAANEFSAPGIILKGESLYLRSYETMRKDIHRI